MTAVRVIAVIAAKPGRRAEVLRAFQANVPNVHAEAGCIEPVATVDAERAGDVRTRFGSDTFVAVEKWASVDALKANAAAPHMAAYAAKAPAAQRITSTRRRPGACAAAVSGSRAGPRSRP